MKKIFTAVLVFVSIISFTGCHDSIFADIKNEINIDSGRMRGSINSFEVFGSYIYVAPAHKGKIYRKPTGNVGTRKGWESINTPDTPVYLSSQGSTLYMLSVTFTEGSGDWEGMNIPVYHEYVSSNGVNWSGPIASYNWDEDGNNIPGMYKNKYSTATSGGITYSISPGVSDSVYGSDGTVHEDDDKTGYLWCLAATSDYILVGSNMGLYHFHVGSNDKPTDNVVGNANGVFDEFRIWAIWVENPALPEGQSVIYVFGSPIGSNNADSEGFYSYIPGDGWNSEK